MLLRGSLLFGLMVAAIGAPPAFAQQSEAQLPRLTEELAGVNRSLDQLVRMLETMIEHQKIDLLLKRIEMKERRALPLESALRSARETVNGVSDELERYRNMVREWEDAESKATRDGREQEAAEFREMIAHSSSEVEYQTAALERYERRVRDLEDDIALLDRDLEMLDDMLNELLEK